MVTDKNCRIAIIGAGPSGLSAAERLKDKGYKNVVVFEKLDRVGGMSLSKTYKADNGKEIVYDLGSIQPMAGRDFEKLVKKYGLEWGRGISIENTKLMRFYDHETRSYIADFKNHYLGYKLSQLPAVLMDAFKVIRKIFKFRRLYKPGMHDCPHLEEASMPIEEWIDSLNLKVIKKVFTYALCSVGTGTRRSAAPNEAALYGLKILTQFLRIPPRYVEGSYRPLRQGYQSIWKEVSRNHDVRFLSKITKIERPGGKKVIIHLYDGRQEEFDYLIVAFPISQLKDIMHMTIDEEKIANNVVYHPVWKAAFLATGLPKEEVLVFPDCYFSNKPNRTPIGILIPEGNVDDETTLYSLTLQPLDNKLDDEKYLASIDKDLNEHFGGHIVKWVDRHYWPYYHTIFNRLAIKEGVFDLFDKIQGENNTHYVGELLTDSGHAEITRFSYGLVDRFWR